LTEDDAKKQRRRKDDTPVFARRSGRVTVDFTGPPLALPGEEPTAAAEDVEGIAEGAVPDAAIPGGRDAWAVDKMKRGSTPPGQWAPAAGGVARRIPVPLAPRPPAVSAEPPPAREKLSTDERQLPATTDSGDAFDLVERAPKPSSADVDLAAEMAECYALGDFTGALRIAELVLGGDAAHPQARLYARYSRQRLEQIYSSRLGSSSHVPVVTVRDSEVRWLGLDHRAGFLLSRVDGAHSVDMLIDVSGMQRLECLKTLVELLDAGAIRMEEPRGM
jgi:hypothetical protein